MLKQNWQKRLAAIFILASFVAGFTTILQAAPTVTLEEIEAGSSLKSTLETPHKSWAKKYTRGPIKALYFIFHGGYSSAEWIAPDTRLRDVVELQNRFNFNGDAVFLGSATTPYTVFGKLLGEERAYKLLNNDYDVYVIGELDFNRFPSEMQFKILEKVCLAGKGLVITNNKSATDFMLPKRRINPTPSLLTDAIPELLPVKYQTKNPNEAVQAYKLGRGRAVWLNYPAWALTRNYSYSPEGFNEYDYQLMQVGKAILWAAKREPRVTVSAATVKRADGVVEPLFTIASHVKNLRVTCEVEWRRISDNQRFKAAPWRGTLNVKPQTHRFAFPLANKGDGFPATLAGKYIADIKIKSAAGDEAFGAVSMQFESPINLEDLVIQESWVEPQQPQVATVNINAPNIPEGAKLNWRLYDCWNNVLEQKTEAARGFNTWHFITPKYATIGMRIKPFLAVNGREISTLDGGFTVANRHRGHFNFLQWDTPNGIMGRIGWEQLRKAGHRLCLVGSFSESQYNRVLADSDISLVPYSTRILDPKDDKGVMKPTCWNDEPAASEYVRSIVSRQKARRQQGVYCYSLGDEGVTKGSCTHPACLKKYQDYLKDQYGTIDALNKSWGEHYKAFSDVKLLDPKNVMETDAIALKKYSRWYDRQAFERWNLMQFSKRFVDEYKRLDEKAITGFEGTGGFKDDIELISSINTFYSPYPSIGDDILRGVADRSLLRANWMGYSKTGDALSDAAWRMVMKEMDAIWYWMWTGYGSWLGYLSPILDFPAPIADLMNEMKPVRDGLGDLLLNLKVKDSGIAVYYNLPSALSGSIENGSRFASPEKDHEGWQRFVSMLGYDSRYIGKKQLLAGALRNRNFKVFLLPMTQALSKQECEAIIDFVQNGGTVIADVRPAVFDGHCNVLPTGGLDNLFGIKRAALPLGILTDDILDIKSCSVDTGIAATTATIGKNITVKNEAEKEFTAPILLTNRFGKGRAILLNFTFPVSATSDNGSTFIAKLLDGLFLDAGISSDALLRAPDGTALEFTETRIWQNGDSIVVGAWWQMQNAWFGPTAGTNAAKPVPAVISLAKKAYVYDLRNGKYLGKRKKIITELRQGRASFFLIQPFKNKGLKLKLADKPRRGALVNVNLTSSLPRKANTTQAVKLEIVWPDGSIPEWATQVVLLKDGKAKADFQIPWNAMPGRWKIQATELFSGDTDDQTWKLK